jgi:D-alanyl-D-alanine carboxypeptidase
MKKIIILFLTILFLFYLTPITFASEPSVSAEAAAMIDVKSGRILYQKNADEKLPIASLTKIMTAIVAIEEGNLSDMVTTSPQAVGVEGSSIYLRLGEKLSLEDMLYGLMLRSGNDAAVAIAEHIGGSVEGFAFLMNEKAEYLGLENTHFVNPHGLDHPEHYSSARDLAILTAYALKNPTFHKIVSTQVKTAPLEGMNWDRKWHNKNKMLRIYEGADGVKTGFTKIAKRCLVSSATRGDRQIAVVVLNDGNDWNDSASLLDYGFHDFQEVEIIRKDQIVTDGDERDKDSLQYVAMRSSIHPLKEGEESEIRSEVLPLKNTNLIEGMPAAYLQVYVKDVLLDSVPLMIKDRSTSTDRDLLETGKTHSFWNNWNLFWRTMF